MGRRFCSVCSPVVLLALFALSLTVRLFTPSYIDSEIHRQVEDYIVLRPGEAKESFRRFANDTDPEDSVHYTRFYFFNITNLDDVRSAGAKPILEELGPYTYRTYDERYDISFRWNGTVSYKERTLYYREPSLTNGSFDDTVVTLNMALVGVLEQIMEMSSFWVRLIMSQIASRVDRFGDGNNSGLFLARTVEELLWGYDDLLLAIVSRFTSVSTEFKFMGNGTHGDESVPVSIMNTGLFDIDSIGQIETWNGLTGIDNWNNYTEPVHGTAGTFFRPFLHGDEILSVWIPQMYRAMTLKKSSRSRIYDIDMLRFGIDPGFWEADDRFYGKYRGLVNATSNSAGGFHGPPLFFSPPHFCGSDPVLSEAVIGLHCDAEKQEFFIDVEPYTGISLRGAVRFMISSAYSSSYPSIDPNLTSTILPIFWMEMHRQATREQTRKIKTDLYWALDLKDDINVASLLCAIFFGVLGILVLILVVLKSCRRKRTSAAAAFHDKSLVSTHIFIDDSSSSLLSPHRANAEGSNGFQDGMLGTAPHPHEP